MKKLGIIGGAGPLASSLFYETLVYESYRLGSTMPETILINYPFTRGLTIQEGQENEAFIYKELMHCLKMLEITQAEICALVCNTLHLYLHSLKKKTIPFISLPELLLEEIRKKKHKKLLLLGTQNTCRSSLYKENEITLLLPSEPGQKMVDEIIDRVLKGIILEKDALFVTQLIEQFSDQIDGIILGCTDLPVLHHHYPFCSVKTIYDSVKLPAQLILRLL
jgi:aspartate racemase